jgi:hypothetical protein
VKPSFPSPVIFRRRRHWRLSELLAYEAVAAGLPQPDPLDPEDERYLTSAQIRKRYGDVSDMWIWRRLAERNSAEAA